MKPDFFSHGRLTALTLFLGLTLALAACAPGATPPPVVSPAATMPPITLQEGTAPTLAPVTPQGEVVTLGFNVRGWT